MTVKKHDLKYTSMKFKGIPTTIAEIDITYKGTIAGNVVGYRAVPGETSFSPDLQPDTYQVTIVAKGADGKVYAPVGGVTKTITISAEQEFSLDIPTDLTVEE